LFLQYAKNTNGIIKGRRFSFDLDGTLVTLPKVAGDYSTVEPIESNIELVKELHKSGNYIIIQTVSIAF
jgi:histidinol phosphatase-like enzyme